MNKVSLIGICFIIVGIIVFLAIFLNNRQIQQQPVSIKLYQFGSYTDTIVCGEPVQVEIIGAIFKKAIIKSVQDESKYIPLTTTSTIIPESFDSFFVEIIDINNNIIQSSVFDTMDTRYDPEKSNMIADHLDSNLLQITHNKVGYALVSKHPILECYWEQLDKDKNWSVISNCTNAMHCSTDRTALRVNAMLSDDQNYQFFAYAVHGL